MEGSKEMRRLHEGLTEMDGRLALDWIGRSGVYLTSIDDGMVGETLIVSCFRLVL